MKAILKILLFAMCTSCLFSGSDIIKVPVLNNYYVTSLGETYHLSYQDKNSLTEKIITANIDSIGWNDKTIVVSANSKYHVIDQVSAKIIQYTNHDEISKSLPNEIIKLRTISEFIIAKQ